MESVECNASSIQTGSSPDATAPHKSGNRTLPRGGGESGDENKWKSDIEVDDGARRLTFHRGHKLGGSVRVGGDYFVEVVQLLVRVVSLKEIKQQYFLSLCFLCS